MLANLKVPAGVVRGATPAMTPGRWYDANFVRWQGGGLTPIGGWDRITDAPLASIPRRILPWTDNDGQRRIAISCDEKLFIEEGSVYSDMTPTGYTGASPSLSEGGYGSNVFGAQNFGDPRADTIDVNALPYTFSLSAWGEQMLSLASSDGLLRVWDPQSPLDPFATISAAPTNLRAMTVTPERHVLAIGGSGTPRRVQWCSREDYTDWNFASTTNTAGFLDLETDAALLAVLNVREGILVFSESDVFLVRFVGSPYVYGAERIATMSGPISPQAMASFDGRAAWMGREGFWIYDGGSVRPLPCDVQDWMYDTINRPYARLYAVASANGLFSEIWFFYPSNTDGDENDRYVIWNYAENWWSIGSMCRTAMCEAGVYTVPVASDRDGHLYEHERGYLGAGASRVGDVYAETGVLNVGDGERFMSVTQAQPDSATVPATTKFSFITQATRDGAETTFGPYTPRSDGYMDVRFSARDVRLRVTATQDDNWTIGAMRLTMQARGKR